MHTLLHCTCGSQYKAWAHVFLRVVVGLAFFYHGYVKVFEMGMANTALFFGNVGIPAASLFAYLVAYGELLGGLAIMLGLLTHWAAKVEILVVLGAIGFVHFGAEGGWFWGYGAQGGYEYQLLLLAASVYLFVHGSGKFALDNVICKSHKYDDVTNV